MRCSGDFLWCEYSFVAREEGMRKWGGERAEGGRSRRARPSSIACSKTSLLIFWYFFRRFSLFPYSLTHL